MILILIMNAGIADEAAQRRSSIPAPHEKIDRDGQKERKQERKKYPDKKSAVHIQKNI